MLEEERVNLEGIFYNEDGTFKPLTDNHGNTNGQLAELRNTYMESEREYFEYLLMVKEIRNVFLGYLDYDSDTLFRYAIKWQEKIEYGMLETEEDLKKMESMTPEQRDNFHMSRLERAEGVMCLLFAAARDKAKILELVKTYENELNDERDLYSRNHLSR